MSDFGDDDQLELEQTWTGVQEGLDGRLLLRDSLAAVYAAGRYVERPPAGARRGLVRSLAVSLSRSLARYRSPRYITRSLRLDRLPRSPARNRNRSKHALLSPIYVSPLFTPRVVVLARS